MPIGAPRKIMSAGMLATTSRSASASTTPADFPTTSFDGSSKGGVELWPTSRPVQGGDISPSQYPLAPHFKPNFIL